MNIELTGQLKFIYELLLKQGKPMHRTEILEAMINSDEVSITGKTPEQTITRIMNANCIQSENNQTSYKSNKFLFSRVKMQTWELLDPAIRQELFLVVNPNDDEDIEDVIENVLRRRKTDPKKRNWIIKNFPDKCQKCGSKTFFKKNNDMYFEIHHIKPLSRGGEDAIENLSKICPTCHREAHYGQNVLKIEEKLLLNTSMILKNTNKE